MSAAAHLARFLTDIPLDVARNCVAHLLAILSWLGLWFGLHVTIEFVVPAVWPHAFDALGRDGKLATAHERNRDARTKVIALVQALCVSFVPALWGRFVSGEYARLKTDMYSSSPFAITLTEANAAYFAWDIFVCFWDRLSLEWHVHAWLAFLSFSLALVRGATPARVHARAPPAYTRARTPTCPPSITTHSQHPFALYMAMVALVFEVSTPFLHARKLLIQTGHGRGRAFQFVQLLFVATFCWSRIVFGFAEAFDFQRRLLALVRSGTAHSDAIALLYCVVIASGHYALSMMWLYHIAVTALRPARARRAVH